MAVQGIVKVVAKGRILDAVETRNVFYYGCTLSDYSQYSGNDYTPIAAKVIDIYTPLLGVINNAWKLYALELFKWDGESWVEIVEGSYNLVGTETVDLSSYQTSFLVSLKTGAKKMLGRKFFAGLDELYSELGSLTGDAITIIASSVVVMLSSVSTTTGHVWYPGIPGKTSAFAPFTSAIIGNLLSTMRRRKPGYGI